MIRYSWFKLIMRLIGVLLIGLSLPTAAGAVASLIYGFVNGANYLEPGALIWLFSLLPALAQLGIGLYLLFGSKWLMERCLRGIDSTCPNCAYDLTGATGNTCSECGFYFRPIPPEPPKAPPTP